MQDSYVWYGALAGLVLIGMTGIALAKQSAHIRDSLTTYVGEAPARWLLWTSWFAYAYSAVYALSQSLTTLPAFDPEGGLPPALAFLNGLVGYPTLTFLNSVISVGHLAALVAAVVLLHRYLKSTST